MEKEAFSSMIRVLEASYGTKLKQDTKKIYWEILKDYKDEEIKKATIILIKELKFFPRIADIVTAIKGSVADEAELAWGCLLEKIEDVGHYQSVSFPKYPAIGIIVERWGGWLEVCNMKFEEEKFKRIEFIKIYPIMKKRGEFPKELAGQFEIDNSNKGYTEESMLRYGIGLDGIKVDRKKIGESKVKKLNEPEEDKFSKYLKKE